MTNLKTAGEALKYSFDTGDRGPFEALFAPDCLNWHNHDKLEVPAATNEGPGVLNQLVDGLHAELIQDEVFPSGELIRIVIRGTVIANGRSFEAHNCIVLTITDAGITRIDDYIDPTIVDQLTAD
jgi:ketosteroid isomerase-like protein